MIDITFFSLEAYVIRRFGLYKKEYIYDLDKEQRTFSGRDSNFVNIFFTTSSLMPICIKVRFKNFLTEHFYIFIIQLM